jgi:hypothetical protein
VFGGDVFGGYRSHGCKTPCGGGAQVNREDPSPTLFCKCGL